MDRHGQNCNNWIGHNEPDRKDPNAKKRKQYPMEVIRKIMAKSSTGGRGRCYYCHTTFSMQYMTQCYISYRQIELVCQQCRKEHALQRVK